MDDQSINRFTNVVYLVASSFSPAAFGIGALLQSPWQLRQLNSRQMCSTPLRPALARIYNADSALYLTREPFKLAGCRGACAHAMGITVAPARARKASTLSERQG
jgi:hypothetical protein